MEASTHRRVNSWAMARTAAEFIRSAAIVALAIAAGAGAAVILVPALVVIALGIVLILIGALLMWLPDRRTVGVPGEPEPEPDEGEDGGGENVVAPSTVSPFRPIAGAEASPTSETCTNCRHYAGVNKQAGQCRRFGPMFDDADDTATGEWPLVIATAWCGEFKGVSAPADATLH